MTVRPVTPYDSAAAVGRWGALAPRERRVADKITACNH